MLMRGVTRVIYPIVFLLEFVVLYIQMTIMTIPAIHL